MFRKNMLSRLIVFIASSIQGGAQNHVFNLLISLGDKYSILVVCPQGYLSERLIEQKLNVCIMDFGPSTVLSLRRLIMQERERYQSLVINTHLLGTTLWVTLATILCDIHKIATLHNPVVYEGMGIVKRLAHPIILKFIGYNINGFIAVSKGIKTSINRYVNSAVAYIPNAVPISVLTKENRLELIDANAPQIAIIGRLSIEKGHRYFIDAAAMIIQQVPGAVFYVIGEGPLRGELEHQTRILGIKDNFVFTGFLQPPIHMLTNIDIVVVASLFEGLPLTLLEVMSIGIPVVATDVGGIPDVVRHEHDGLLVQAGNAVAIHNCVMRLLSDNQLYRLLSKNSQIKITTEFSFRKSIDVYIEQLKY